MAYNDQGARHPTAPITGESVREEARLAEAIRRADQLLVTSLKVDERRRNRRNIILISISLGGVLMLTALCVALLGFGGKPETAAPNVEKGAQTEEASARDPERAAALSQEGWQLWQKQDFAAAIGKFDEAAKLDPKNSGALNGLGWANFNAGHYDPAEEAFKKLLKLEPNHPAALNGMGQLYLVERKYDEAEKYLLKAANKDATAAWYGLAKVYLLKGKYDQAARWAKKIADSGDADPGVAEMLKAAKAKKLPDELRTQIEPPAPEALDVSRAWQLMNQGRRVEAKAIFEAVLAKSPTDANALNGMGWLLFFGGERKEAKPYFEKALAVDPKAAGSMNGLARVLYAEGDVEGAIKIWKDMVEKIPGVHAGTAGLADAYIEKGELKKAVPLLEQLVKANPDDQQLKEKLARARAGDAK